MHYLLCVVFVGFFVVLGKPLYKLFGEGVVLETSLAQIGCQVLIKWIRFSNRSVVIAEVVKSDADRAVISPH